jgi:hypothetical protein
MSILVVLLMVLGAAFLWSALDRIARLERRIGAIEADGQWRSVGGDGAIDSGGMDASEAQADFNQAPSSNTDDPTPYRIAARTKPAARVIKSSVLVPQEPTEEVIPVGIAAVIREAEIAAELAKPSADIPEPGEFAEPAGIDAASFEPAATTTGTPARRGISFNFEDLFGRRLPIWAGGITLAIAGILIVKYAIDAGFFGRIFTPWVQSLSGIAFGIGLIAGAEYAHKNRDRVNDPRVSQALSGAGIATLYGAFLVAGNVYGLIGPLAAFFGMAAVTAAALWLSVRHGAPSALLGLAGGLAAPAMVGGISANVPLLAVYLALTIAGLSGVSRMQRWPWLALAALLGGAGWSLWIILASSALDMLASLSVGGLVILMAIAIPLFAAGGPRSQLLRAAAALVGAAQLALLVAIGGFIPLHWGLFALLAAAGQWLARRDRTLAIIPSISLGLSVFLLMIWPQPAGGWLLTIGVALAAIHGVPLMLKLWHSPARVQTAVEFCALAAAAPVVAIRHYAFASGGTFDGIIALVAAVAALLPAAAISRGWNNAERSGDVRFAALTGTAAALLSVASWFALPHWSAPLAVAAIAAALLFFGERARDARVGIIATGFACGAFALFLITTPSSIAELGTLLSGRGAGPHWHSLLRWGGLTALFALFAYRAAPLPTRTAAHIAAGGLAYALLSALLPMWALPLAMAAVAAAMLAIGVNSSEGFGKRNAVIFALAALPLLLITMTADLPEIGRLYGDGDAGFDGQALLRWGALTALFVAFAALAERAVRYPAQIVAALVGYGLIAQIVPGSLVPLIAPLSLAAMAAASMYNPWPRLQPAMQVAGALITAWALAPAAVWSASAALSLTGRPMMIDPANLSAAILLKQLFVPAAVIAAALWLLRAQLPSWAMRGALMLGTLLGGMALHSFYRLGYAQVAGDDFSVTGIGQRLIWAALLMIAGILVWRKGSGVVRTVLAPVLTGTACAHVLIYSLFLHNPLWTAQAVGGWPVFNWIAPLSALLPLGLYLLRPMLPGPANRAERFVQATHMTMIVMFCWATLRHFFHGSILTDPGVGAAEDISRSMLGIALAIGFLLRGIRTQRRDWRLASLALMLLATAKVFLMDTAGLDGLLRIGSFIALGFSLIGIGWLYSRQLGRDKSNKAAVIALDND